MANQTPSHYTMSNTGRVTPLWKQYMGFRQQYPDYILFFRLGDFYETFQTDAEILAKVCDLTLTSRPVSSKKERVPMAGVPNHHINEYIQKMREAGYDVAVIEEMEGYTDNLRNRALTHTYKAIPVDAIPAASEPEPADGTPATGERAADPRDARIAELEARVQELEAENAKHPNFPALKYEMGTRVGLRGTVPRGTKGIVIGAKVNGCYHLENGKWVWRAETGKTIYQIRCDDGSVRSSTISEMSSISID